MVTTRHYHRLINLKKKTFSSDIFLEYCYKFGLFPNPPTSAFSTLDGAGKASDTLEMLYSVSRLSCVADFVLNLCIVVQMQAHAPLFHSWGCILCESPSDSVVNKGNQRNTLTLLDPP